MPLDGSEAIRRGDAGLLPKQMQLVDDIKSKIIVFRGGYRAGKTTGLVAKAYDLGCRNWPHPVLFVEPTFPMIRSVFVETAMRLCRGWKLRCRWKESKKTLTIGRRHPVSIWCRSADSPRSLEGLTVAAALCDEWELYEEEALVVAMARVSIGPLQQIVFGGTPEGYGAGYRLIEKNKQPGTNVIISPSRDNFTLRESYVSDMASRMTTEQIAEKLGGDRSPPSKRVYTRFSRTLHLEKPCVDLRRGRLEMWCDFNVDPMAWGFFLVDDSNPERIKFHCVGELVVSSTDSQRQAAEATKWIRAWNSRSGRNDTHHGMTALCDAASAQRSAITRLSHVENLRTVGFEPLFSKRNPYVEDRVASVQLALGGPNPYGGMWPVRLTFDEAAAPYIVSCISTQPRAEDGSPSKDTKLGLDHGSDLTGYGIMWHDPSTMPRANGVDDEHARAWDEARGRERR